ncbi:hypothetical protein H5410_038962 [Solanum commersonii]|uniref:Uncharacterized protein n=1 Tax=Solanum commersonii TaxID=4109 RepID=A0A9J5YC38_SOLCO|nr:hypothetical protein H5410_038962 [Solanum commersonii]
MQDFSDDGIDAMEELANQPIPEHVTREIWTGFGRYRSGVHGFFSGITGSGPSRFRPVVPDSIPVPVVPVPVPLPAIMEIIKASSTFIPLVI